MVVEDFRAWSAGAGVAHGPEIVGARDSENLRLRQAADLLPQFERLVVVHVNGREQTFRRQIKGLGHQVPRQLDRVVLEIVAEGKVPQHLEEGVVARGVAHVVEIVVLAAGAHAFLRGDRAHVGPLLDAGEDVLELHHAGIGEHQRRVVARHERRRRHHRVPVLGEIVEEGRPDLVDAAHGPVLYRPRVAVSRDALAAPDKALRAVRAITGRTPLPLGEREGREKIRPAAGQMRRAGSRGLSRLPGRAAGGVRGTIRSGRAIRRGRKARPARQASAASESGASSSPLPASGSRMRSASRPEFWRIAVSILPAISGFCFRNVFAFSRPWPSRWLS